MISPQFRPLIGGYERAAERLCGALADAGLEVVVITERRERDWLPRELVNGFSIRRLPCVYKRGYHMITSLFSFGAFLLRFGLNFDVWHVHQYGHHAALAVVLGKLMRRPVVLKLTSSASSGIQASLGVGLRGFFARFLHRRVDACLVVSDETAIEALRFGIPPARVHLLPNGVDGRQFHSGTVEQRGESRSALGLNASKIVLWVGRMSAEKTPLGIIEAWKGLDSSTRDGAMLVLIGDGPQMEEVTMRATDPEIAHSIRLTGQESDVARWYRAADIYVISSVVEGLSNTMIEALASGLPVISTRVSGSSALLGPPPAGLIVDIGDSRALSNAMQSLLVTDHLRNALAANARFAFESRFSLASLCRKMILLYGSLLGTVEARKAR